MVAGFIWTFQYLALQTWGVHFVFLRGPLAWAR